jgi:hypothetical protein
MCPPFAVHSQFRHEGLDGVEHATQVHIDHPVEVLVGLLIQRGTEVSDAGIVEHVVHLAEMLLDSICNSPHGMAIGDITRHGEHFCSVATQDF